MLLRKTSWFWKSGLAVISFQGTPDVLETVIVFQDIQEECSGCR